jgi:hypothetical protein
MRLLVRKHGNRSALSKLPDEFADTGVVCRNVACAETTARRAYHILQFRYAQRPVQASHVEGQCPEQAGGLPGAQVRRQQDHSPAPAQRLLDQFASLDHTDQRQGFGSGAQPERTALEQGLAGLGEGVTEQAALARRA